MMKAFSIYPKEEIDLRILLNKLQNYGKINCDFNSFSCIYNEWHQINFPGIKISTNSAIWRDDFFRSFVNFIANQEIK